MAWNLNNKVLIGIVSFVAGAAGCGLTDGGAALQDAATPPTKPVGATLHLINTSRSFQICFDNFSSKKGSCSGLIKHENKEPRAFSGGSCTYEGLNEEPVESEKMLVTCAMENTETGGSESCFAEEKIEKTLIEAKIDKKSGKGIWRSQSAPQADLVRTSLKSNCKVLFGLEEEKKKKEEKCETTTSQKTALHLAEAPPAAKSCEGLSGDDQFSCFAENMALEVYDTSTANSRVSLADIAKGLHLPERCYVYAKGYSPESLFVYRRDQSWKSVAEGAKFERRFASGGIEYSDLGNYFTTRFDLDSPALVQSADVLYPTGSAASAVDQNNIEGMGSFTTYVFETSGTAGLVMRWVPRELCAGKYLGEAYPSQLHVPQKEKEEKTEKACPAPEKK